MVGSTFATGACLLSALLASSTLATPTGNKPPKQDTCKQILLPMSESTHGAAFNITVGTPPQVVTLLSDWTWQTTWVDTAHCAGVYSVEKCIPKGQQFFDDTKSSTFRNTTEKEQTFTGTDYTPGIPFVTTF